MSFTQLSPSATPGRRYSFVPKSGETGEHTGAFTSLSVLAVPGPRHSFSAKTPAVPEAGPHSGLFTALSVLAVPGMRHVFEAKTAGEVSEIDTGGGRPAWLTHQKKIHEQIGHDDEDFFEIIHIIAASGILDN